MTGTTSLTWKDLLSPVKHSDWFKGMLEHIQQQREQGVTIYPPASDVFNALRYTEFKDIKVVILGQDPYHGPRQAHGLAFSVQQGIKPPPSLLNIYKELSRDIPEFRTPNHGHLISWAQQGVLLLNTVLTVEAGQAHSHANLGWERFTDIVIDMINQHHQGVVFLLWGSHAQKKCALINEGTHFLLKAPHPSPLSAHRGFIGCGHFSECNQLLTSQNKAPIHWHLD